MTLTTHNPASLNPITLRLPSTADLSDDEFFELCQLNQELCIERTAQHELMIMSPTGSETDERNFDLIGLHLSTQPSYPLPQRPHDPCRRSTSPRLYPGSE